MIHLEPCQAREGVYTGKSTDSPHFYMYHCFFRDLGVCLPITQFECDFLNFVNSAPCQLHPNSWGFLRAFQVLCSVEPIYFTCCVICVLFCFIVF
uniref:Uncharacterized protein n=1 Tax=Cajanus cajan TaxID=3821 RepID=A0A151UC59_CAJCA|nr:hypothetical protein KK1_021178 [Cajanus cajan]